MGPNCHEKLRKHPAPIATIVEFNPPLNEKVSVNWTGVAGTYRF